MIFWNSAYRQNNNNNSTNGKSKKPETANSSTAANKAKAMFNLKSLDQITKEKEIENAKKAAAALANGVNFLIGFTCYLSKRILSTT